MSARGLARLRDLVARARLERDKPPVGIRNPANARCAIRYATEEERIEARRKSWRESKKRLHGVCPRCGGGKAATPTVKMCRPCWSQARVANG